MLAKRTLEPRQSIRTISTHTRTHTRARARTHTHPHTHTISYTPYPHTLTYILSLSLSLSRTHTLSLLVSFRPMIQNNPETRIHPVDHLVALLFVQVCITRAQAPKRDPRHVPIPPSPNVTDLLACLLFFIFFSAFANHAKQNQDFCLAPNGKRYGKMYESTQHLHAEFSAYTRHSQPVSNAHIIFIVSIYFHLMRRNMEEEPKQ